MKHKLSILLLLVFGLLVGIGLQANQTVSADSNPKVLLVYDSQNVAEKGNQKIDAMQRLLSSLNLNVNTISLHDYRSGMLKKDHYTGVITMVNWAEGKFDNRAFDTDRDKFNGVKLHIGADLSADEARAMDIQTRPIYHQQFAIKASSGAYQQLPFSSSILIATNLPKKAQRFGTLITQTSTQTRYPYGVINQRQGYLPYFNPQGLDFLIAGQLIAKLFNRSVAQAPMLTVTDVTPYSDLTQLNNLSLKLYQAGVPFVVSTTSLSTINDFKAFGKFAEALRNVEKRGGVVFLKTPSIVTPSASSGQELNNIIQSSLVSLGQQNVFPVGITAENYWNQDQVYRTNALKEANTRILLTNPASFAYAAQDNQAGTAQTSYYGVSLNQFTSVRKLTTVNWPIPTALTVGLPKSNQASEQLIKKVNRLNVALFDPTAANQAMNIQAGSADFSLRHGNYYLNDSLVQITDKVSTPYQSMAANQISPINKFFKTQSNIMMVFFSIILVILIIFIWIGRRIYRRMFID